ncbi:MAG: hypothetical protein AAGA66_01585 [Bacteroidota bacterium]
MSNNNSSTLYRKYINVNIRDEWDYNTFRKIKSLNYVSLLSALLAVAGAIIAGIQAQYALLLFMSTWVCMLFFVIYLNSKKKVNITRVVFMIFWIFYANIKIHIFDDVLYTEYIYLSLIIFTVFLFDSVWFNLLMFAGYSYMFPIVTFDSLINVFQLLRYMTFLTALLFLKKVIMEIENLLTIKHQQTMALELARVEEQKKTMKAELDFKDKELVNLAFHITSKDDFLKKLKGTIKDIRADDDAASLKELEKFIKSNENLIEDREEFERYIQNVCEGFFIKLAGTYPKMSKNDQKLAAIIRLGLSSKEMATLLNISPKSVDQSRYRLRKKMGLEGESNLTEVLQGL